jgi:GNAT superfamily N-acetyltransferase
MPEITRAEVADLPAILALQKLAFQTEAELYGDDSLPPLRQSLEELCEEHGRTIILKATEAGVIIGSVRALLREGTCLVGRLIVHPAHRRRGLGSALMQAIEATFPAAARFELFTGDRSVANQRLYHGLGYTELRRTHFPGAVTLVFMEKSAAPR